VCQACSSAFWVHFWSKMNVKISSCFPWNCYHVFFVTSLHNLIHSNGFLCHSHTSTPLSNVSAWMILCGVSSAADRPQAAYPTIYNEDRHDFYSLTSVSRLSASSISRYVTYVIVTAVYKSTKYFIWIIWKEDASWLSQPQVWNLHWNKSQWNRVWDCVLDSSDWG